MTSQCGHFFFQREGLREADGPTNRSNKLYLSQMHSNFRPEQFVNLIEYYLLFLLTNFLQVLLDTAIMYHW